MAVDVSRRRSKTWFSMYLNIPILATLYGQRQLVSFMIWSSCWMEKNQKRSWRRIDRDNVWKSKALLTVVRGLSFTSFNFFQHHLPLIKYHHLTQKPSFRKTRRTKLTRLSLTIPIRVAARYRGSGSEKLATPRAKGIKVSCSPFVFSSSVAGTLFHVATSARRWDASLGGTLLLDM